MSTSGARGHVDGARWTAETEILFIDLIHEEVLRGNFLGSTFSNSVWLELTNNLNSLSGKCYSIKQCRNKLVRIKLHWRKFKTLMLSDTGLGWDSERELPVASDNWWAIWEEAHPQDIGLRKRPCRRYLKLCSIFERNTASGSRARSSSQLPPTGPNHTIDLDEDNVGYDSPTNIQGVASGSKDFSVKRRKHKKHVLERLVDSIQQSSNSFTGRLDEAAKEKQIEKSNCKECIRTVRALPGVTVDMVAVALDYFADPDRRTMFLELNPAEQLAVMKKISH